MIWSAYCHGVNVITCEHLAIVNIRLCPRNVCIGFFEAQTIHIADGHDVLVNDAIDVGCALSHDANTTHVQLFIRGFGASR